MKKMMSLLLASVLALGLVACGGDTSSEAASTASLETQTSVAAGEGTESEAETAGEDDSVQKILDAGKLVVMTNASFPPYEYIKDTAEDTVVIDGITGVDIELAQLIADELGVELAVIDMDFDGLIVALKSGKGDLVAAGMSINEERLESVDFSTPYVDTTLSVIVPADSELALEDLDGLNISVQQGTTSDLFVSDEDNLVPGDILRFKSAVDAGNAVTGGKADACVVDVMTGESIVANSGGALKMLEEPIGTEQYAMAINKNSPALLAIVNKVLEQAVEDGTVDELIAKHMELAKDI